MTFAQPFHDYEILDRVGAGAMGTVFKARHKKLGRIVALKVLKPSLARDSRYVDRLRREARIVAALNHPHIVTGYDLGEEGGYHFFVMEFVEGKSLRGLLAEWGMFAEEYVLEIAKQIALALDHAFQNKIIHRDIKPGNVLIDEHGKVKLTDMGLAKGPADLTLTRDGATVGTPQYISPEQARNPQDVDVRSDLYSLGATLYHMATGVPPFTGDTMAELITKVLQDPPVPPNELNPALSSGLSLVVRKLLAKDLRVRYQTPRELLDDLERLESELPPQVDEERLAQGESERRFAVPMRFLVAVLLAVALAGAVWVGMQLRGESATVASEDPFLIELDETLAGMATPGERLLHLRAVAKEPPRGREIELLRRENLAFRAVQAALDATAAGFTGPGWQDLAAWLRHPGEWPGRARFEKERLARRVVEATGMLPRQLPSTINTAGIVELRSAVDEEISRRDTEFIRRLETYVATALPDRVHERLLAGDYAGAQRLWEKALESFCDGVREPARERLAEATLRQARDRCDQAWQIARPAIDTAETAVADEMRRAVANVVGYFDEQVAEGADPADLAARITEFRQSLLQDWPASSRFRPDRDPWREIDRMIGEVRQRTALAAAAAADERFEHRSDLAWRALCHGDTAAAQAIFEDIVAPSESALARLAQHRRALADAAAVEARLLAVLVKSERVVKAFPRRGNGLAVDVRATAEGGQPTLLAQGLGESARPAAVSDFRFSDLLREIERFEGQPFAGLPAEQVARGKLVFRLVADDFTGIDRLLRTANDAFLVEQIAPRIQRVRDTASEVIVDRAGVMQRVREALAKARQSLRLRELESAIVSFELRVKDNDRTELERRELRQAKTWLKLARRRADVQNDIAAEWASGADIQVDVDEAEREIAATLTVRGEQLMRGAFDGWELQNGRLTFVTGARPWSEVHLQRLECDTGLPVRSSGRTRTALELDFVLPSPAVEPRFYIVQFRGIAIALVLTRDNAVHAAFLEGDPRRQEHAKKAFERAMRGVLDRVRAVAVPGAVHRLTIDVTASWGRTQATVSVRFEGRELMRGQRRLDPESEALMVLYPRQELQVERLRVRGRGL